MTQDPQSGGGSFGRARDIVTISLPGRLALAGTRHPPTGTGKSKALAGVKAEGWEQLKQHSTPWQ